MKRIQYFSAIFLLLFSLIFSSCQEQAPYILKGTALNTKSDSLYIALPSYGVRFYNPNNMKVPLGPNGEFEFVIPASENGFASIYHRGTRKYLNFWIESGVTDSMVIDYEGEELPIFYGDRLELLKFQTSVERAAYFHSNDRVYYQFYKDSVVTDLKEKVADKIEAERDQLEGFLAEGLINEDYLNAFMLDSEYHWKNVLSSVYWHHYYYKYILERESIYNEEWDREFKALFADVNLDHKEAYGSKYYFDFLKEHAMLTNEWNGVEIDSTLAMEKQIDASHNQRIENIKDLYDGQIEELLWGDYIFNAAIQRRFEKSILESYDEYIEVYPNSSYTKVMEKHMEPIRDYHVKLEQPMSDKIIMIENAHEFTTFEQIVEPYKGELIYIDMWATWCGPCKQEFEYKEGLYEFLEDKPVRLVYLSSDRDEQAEKWKEMVNFYGLEGVNMRISQELFWKIWQEMLGSDIASIPRYLIVDKEGNLIVDEAAQPSEGQKLYDELAKYL